jgi:hypothetical protein
VLNKGRRYNTYKGKRTRRARTVRKGIGDIKCGRKSIGHVTSRLSLLLFPLNTSADVNAQSPSPSKLNNIFKKLP